MAFSSRRLGLFAGLAATLALPACSASEDNKFTGGSSPTPPSSATLRFESPKTLALATGAVEEVAVLGEPAAAYQIAFALLGEPLDAWLDHAAVAAEPGTGRARVELHAPSKATTFRIRASLLDETGAPGASADRAVAVSEEGFGSVEVTPLYDGSRPITEWTASVAAGFCKEIAPDLPQDPAGAIMTSAPPGSPLIIENAPVGPNLAVVARAGHFAWGCADTAALTPGGTVKVDVKVINKELDLSATTLEAMFRHDDDATALAPIHEKGGALLAETFVPMGSKVGSVVLNGMAALVPQVNMGTFASQRINKGWDSLAAMHFAAQSPGLRQQLELWIASGLVQQSPSFEGLLVPGDTPELGTLVMTKVGSVDAAAAGAPASAPLTWKAEQTTDKVLMASSFSWQPSRFAGAAALGPAQLDFPSAASVADALTLSADCAGLASAMGAFGTCDVACVEQLCAAAIGARFGSALAASQMTGQVATMSLQASPDAMVGDEAEPLSLAGHFLGDATDGQSTVTVTGDLTAKAK